MKKISTMGSNTHSGINVDYIKNMGDAKIYDSTANKVQIMGESYCENCKFDEIKSMGEADFINSEIGKAKFMGETTIKNSKFNNVSAMGDLKVKESGKINSLNLMGNLEAENFECGILSIGGENTKIWGIIVINKFSFNSYTRIRGKVFGTTLENRLGLNIDADIKFENILFCQPVKGSEIECENFYALDKLELQGINAEYVFIRPFPKSRVKNITGAKVMICRDFSVTEEFRNIPKNYPDESYERYNKEVGILEADIIEADEIYLENVNANCVRGQKIVIGKNCNIRRVEYSIELEASKNSKIAEVVKENE